MTQQTMQAIRVHQFGGPEQLLLEDVARPYPGAGEVLIRIHATGVLPAEWKMREGFFKGIFPTVFPYIPGSAVAGVVEEVGPGVTMFAPGQAVFGRTTNGAYAEYTTTAVEAPALTPQSFSLLALKPDALSFDEAATISGGASTAWEALFSDGNLQAGQRVLIHGAAGGVGSFATQFARWKGAHVIATASTGNIDFVHSLGADQAIDYTVTRFEEAAADVDLVLDTIGGDTLQRSIDLIKPGGTLVSLLGVPDPIHTQAQKRGIRAMKNASTPTNATLHAIAQLIVEGQVKPTIFRTFALAKAAQAHALSQNGHGRGRIVLHIAD